VRAWNQKCDLNFAMVRHWIKEEEGQRSAHDRFKPNGLGTCRRRVICAGKSDGLSFTSHQDFGSCVVLPRHELVVSEVHQCFSYEIIVDSDCFQRYYKVHGDVQCRGDFFLDCRSTVKDSTAKCASLLMPSKNGSKIWLTFSALYCRWRTSTPSATPFRSILQTKNQ